jgi:hypothetical protein
MRTIVVGIRHWASPYSILLRANALDKKYNRIRDLIVHDVADACIMMESILESELYTTLHAAGVLEDT